MLSREEVKKLKKEEMVDYILELQQQLEATKPLKEENENLKEYVKMANDESQSMNLELRKTQNLLQDSLESQQTLLQSLDALVKVSVKNLDNNTRDYAISKLGGKR